jgi:hypothetical protein
VRKTLTENELAIRHELAAIRKYPRWKYVSYTKGFLLYTSPNCSAVEVFKEKNGRWSAGRYPRATWHEFGTLAEALRYGEQLAGLHLTGVTTGRGHPVFDSDGIGLLG